MSLRKNNKVIFALALTIILLIQTFANCVAYAETNKDNPSNNNYIINYMDTEMNQLVVNKLAKGVTTSIVQNNEVILSKGYGYSDEKTGSKVDPESTIFKIGSVSKIFVALAAMQLKEQGKLDLNAPITQYFETDFPKFKYPITMENLLTHTAGFEDLYSPLEVKLEKEIIPLKDFVRNYMPDQVYKPGEVSAYSNYGISLAGYVIEKISGMSFYDYVSNPHTSLTTTVSAFILPMDEGFLYNLRS